jgi:hypothetical protein
MASQYNDTNINTPLYHENVHNHIHIQKVLCLIKYIF